MQVYSPFPSPSPSSHRDRAAARPRAWTPRFLPSRTERASASALSPQERRLARLAAFVLFGYVLLANAWVNDDAYITFRVIDNWLHGYGLRWNIVERVQVYTHPLWLFLLSGVEVVTGEPFYSTLAVSFALSLGALALALRALPLATQGLTLFALLLSSKAFIDYTSSGLENPLTYALYAWFALVYLRPDARPRREVVALRNVQQRPLAPATLGAAEPDGASLDGAASRRTLGLLTLIASLAFVNRIDSVAPLLPALLARAWSVARAHHGHHGHHGLKAVLRPAIVGSLPAVAWLIFAVVYYGFPFPNTYYAKIATGLPTSLRLQQGLAYLANSLRFDPITLIVIVTAAALFFVRSRDRADRHSNDARDDDRQADVRPLACGLFVGLAYVVWVGGDYMSGRFLAAMAFTAALIVARGVTSWPAAIGALTALALYTVVWPHVPLKTTSRYEMAWPWQTQNGIKDERGAFHAGTNILDFAPFTARPAFPFVPQGESLRASAAPVAHLPTIGMAGYFAGPEKYIVDVNGLGDPLMARLPVDEAIYFDFWTSHYTRAVPEGYDDSRRTGENRITDPLVRDYFERLRLITSGPIWSWARWQAIARMNLGRDRDFHAQVLASRELDISVRVDTPRFSTDIGERTPERLLRAPGAKGGFLLLGPSVPLRAGLYDVEWHGALETAPGDELGFLLVCHDDCRTVVARQPIHRAHLAPGSDLIAAERFRLPEGVSDIEYRLFVQDGVKLSLSRVVLRTAY